MQNLHNATSRLSILHLPTLKPWLLTEMWWRLTTKSAAVRIEQKQKEQHVFSEEAQTMHRIHWTTQPLCARPSRRPAARGLGSTAKVCPDLQEDLLARRLGSTAFVCSSNKAQTTLSASTDSVPTYKKMPLADWVTQRQDYKRTIWY